MKQLLFWTVVGLCMAGCVDRVNNMFVETKKATPKYTSVGHINANAPIVKEPQKQPSIFEKIESQKVAEKNKKLNPEFDMVGYVVSMQKDPDVNLYVYTFTDALRSKRIQFYSRELLKYKPSELVRINVKNNLLQSHRKYHTVTGKRSINSYIQTAKEYFIKVK